MSLLPSTTYDVSRSLHQPKNPPPANFAGGQGMSSFAKCLQAQSESDFAVTQAGDCAVQTPVGNQHQLLADRKESFEGSLFVAHAATSFQKSSPGIMPPTDSHAPITRREDMPTSNEELELLAQQGRVRRIDTPFGTVYRPFAPERAEDAITRWGDMPTSTEELELLAQQGRVLRVETPFGNVYRPFGPPEPERAENAITRREDMPKSTEELELLAQQGRVLRIETPMGVVYRPYEPERAADAITRNEDMPKSTTELERLAEQGRVKRIETPFGNVYRPFEPLSA